MVASGSDRRKRLVVVLCYLGAATFETDGVLPFSACFGTWKHSAVVQSSAINIFASLLSVAVNSNYCFCKKRMCFARTAFQLLPYLKVYRLVRERDLALP